MNSEMIQTNFHFIFFDHILIGVTIVENIAGHNINTLNYISSLRQRQDKISICVTPAAVVLFLGRFPQLYFRVSLSQGTSWLDKILFSFVLSDVASIS